MAFACGIDRTKDAQQLIDFIWLDYKLKIIWKHFCIAWDMWENIAEDGKDMEIKLYSL